MNLWGIQGWSGKQNHKVKVLSHCEVKKSPELYSKTFKPSKTKELLPVSMKRPWGMGIAYSFLSLCRQSIGFKLFLADRKEEIPDKIKFIPIVPHPPTIHCFGESGSHLLYDNPIGTEEAVRCPSLSSRVTAPALANSELAMVYQHPSCTGGPKLTTVSRCVLVSAEQKGIMIPWSPGSAPACCWSSLLPVDAGGSCSSN